MLNKTAKYGSEKMTEVWLLKFSKSNCNVSEDRPHYFGKFLCHSRRHLDLVMVRTLHVVER